MHRWGYAPAVEALEENLIGGVPPIGEVTPWLRSDPRFRVQNGFVTLRGHEHLLWRSSARVATDRVLNGDAWAVAQRFATDLVHHCPFVNCVAVSGSLASGGFSLEDDLDFDLVVRTGTKYITYLLATFLGLKYSWKYRGRQLNRMHRVLSLPKLVCINVVWSDDETKPFVRKDADLAFELLRCRPIFGADQFDAICRENPWVTGYFPQLSARRHCNSIQSNASVLWRILRKLANHALALRTLDASSRRLVWCIYHFVQWTRRNDPDVVARVQFLRKVKWPYEVLQD